MTFALILAGGTGDRMKDTLAPKQFLPLMEKPVIIHTAEKFCKMEVFEKIIVLCPKDSVTYTKELFSKYCPAEKRILILSGGVNRNKSLIKGIEFIKENYGVDDDALIVSHDAVRPFVTQKMLEESIEIAKNKGVSCAVIPETDTLAESQDGTVSTFIPERSRFYKVQTPQSFKARLFTECYSRLTEKEKSTLTDACKVFTLCKEKVHLFKGSENNIKITYPIDMKIAEIILQETQRSTL